MLICSAASLTEYACFGIFFTSLSVQDSLLICGSHPRGGVTVTIYDEVLKTLLSVNSKENSTIDPHHILGEKCPHLTVQQIEAILGEMEQTGHIKRIVGNRRTVKAILLPSAYLYFNKQVYR